MAHLPHITEEDAERLPGQVEWSSADVDVRITLGQTATQFLQIIPGVLVQVRILTQTTQNMNINKLCYLQLVSGVLLQVRLFQFLHSYNLVCLPQGQDLNSSDQHVKISVT